MFDGKVTSRKVDIGGKRVKTDTKNVLDQARKQREQRAIERQRAQAARTIQARFRGYSARMRTKREARAAFTKKMGDIRGLKHVLSMKGVAFIVPSDALSQLASQLLYFCDPSTDATFVEELLSLLTESLLSSDPSLHFLANVPAQVSPSPILSTFLSFCSPPLCRLSMLTFALSRLLPLIPRFIAYPASWPLLHISSLNKAPMHPSCWRSSKSKPARLILLHSQSSSHSSRTSCRGFAGKPRRGTPKPSPPCNSWCASVCAPGRQMHLSKLSSCQSSASLAYPPTPTCAISTLFLARNPRLCRTYSRLPSPLSRRRDESSRSPTSSPCC